MSTSGQVEVHCIKCSSDGELRVGFDFDIQSLDVGRIGSAITDVLHGLKPKPFYNRAIMTFELVKPYRMEANMRTTVHAGLSVRWPGLVSPLSGKKVLGDKMMKEGEKKFITVRSYSFGMDKIRLILIVNRLERFNSSPGTALDSCSSAPPVDQARCEYISIISFLALILTRATSEIDNDMSISDLTSHSYMPNGLLAKMDFLNPSNNYFNPYVSLLRSRLLCRHVHLTRAACDI